MILLALGLIMLLLRRRSSLQADDAKEDDPMEVEDVGYAQCET